MKPAGARRGAAGIAWAALLVVIAGPVSADLAETAQAPGKSPVPAELRLYELGSGRFVVAAEPGEEGQRLARLAEDAWETWRGPLALPDRLPVGITVRLSPGDRWNFEEPWWRVAGEPGGVVSVWIRSGGEAGLARERRWLTALAEGALHRQAMFLGVAPERLATPDWLAAGAAEAALVRSNPALLEAWQQAAGRGGRVPPLRALLAWSGAQTSPASDPRRPAAYAAWHWLQAESGRGPAWKGFQAALLGGSAPGLALVNAYAESFGRADAAEIELAWQTGAAWQARARTTPVMDAEESRRHLAAADRIVLASAEGGSERVAKLGELWSERADAYVAVEREARIAWLTANFSRMHPFYRNAAGSLGRVLLALREGDAKSWSEASADWRRDFPAGRELEEASGRLLDAASK